MTIGQDCLVGIGAEAVQALVDGRGTAIRSPSSSAQPQLDVNRARAHAGRSSDRRGRAGNLHASVLVDAEIDRVAKDHDEQRRHGGEFDRRRPAIVADEAGARRERWRLHDPRSSHQLTSSPGRRCGAV